MVVLVHHHLQLPLPPPPTRSKKLFRPSISMSSSTSEPPLDFPYLSAPQRRLMVSLLSSVETHLSPHLLPPSLPPDVQHFQSPSGSSKGALHIRSGQQGSVVDLLLGSWIHCDLPSGSALDIATVFAFLSPQTDAPHLLVEYIQSSPNSLVLIMDLLPRKDLVLHPGYLQTFYEDTQLEKQRQKLVKLPETILFSSSSLYIRSVLSPTAISVSINCISGDESKSIEEIVRDCVDEVAKVVAKTWLDGYDCDCGGREVGGSELVARDALIKKKAVEIDLAANLPRLFGEEVAGRVVEAIQKAFGV